MIYFVITRIDLNFFLRKNIYLAQIFVCLFRLEFEIFREIVVN